MVVVKIKMATFISLEAGEAITAEECLAETKEFVERIHKAEADTPKDDPLVVIEWTYRATGYQGHGSPISLTTARAATGSPNLMPGDRYSDRHHDNYLRLVNN